MNKKCHLFSLTEAVGSRFFQGDFISSGRLGLPTTSQSLFMNDHLSSSTKVENSQVFGSSSHSTHNHVVEIPVPRCAVMHKQPAVNRDANSRLNYCLCNILSLQICSNIFNFSLLICLSHFLLYSSVPLFLRSPHFSWLHFFHFFTSYLMENVDCLKSTMRL